MKEGKTSKLTSENIYIAVKALKKNLKEKVNGDYFLLPFSEKSLDRTKYSGRGRPRKDDYIYSQIDWGKKIPIK